MLKQTISSFGIHLLSQFRLFVLSTMSYRQASKYPALAPGSRGNRCGTAEDAGGDVLGARTGRGGLPLLGPVPRRVRVLRCLSLHPGGPAGDKASPDGRTSPPGRKGSTALRAAAPPRRELLAEGNPEPFRATAAGQVLGGRSLRPRASLQRFPQGWAREGRKHRRSGATASTPPQNR